VSNEQGEDEKTDLVLVLVLDLGVKTQAIYCCYPPALFELLGTPSAISGPTNPRTRAQRTRTGPAGEPGGVSGYCKRMF
jgi:hypothetical protein